MLSTGVVWREIAGPFVGIGVSLRRLADEQPGLDTVQHLLAEVGLGGAVDWLFIDYVTWGGPIECVYGLGSFGGRAFGPVGESDRDTAQSAYLELMGEFGVAEADALNFPPFIRGFWGESCHE
jgi:hypothetical protein